jgi:hypothetical protein
VQVLQQSRLSRAPAIGTITKRTTGATDGPKSLKGFCIGLLCQLAADRLAAAGLMLALRWPSGTLASRPIAFWTLVPSDACHYRHWSLSALVTVGAGWREKPLHQPVTIQRLIQFAVQTKPPVPA